MPSHTILRARLGWAARLDCWEARRHRLAEQWGWPQAWLQEFRDYLNDPRMTPEEFWVRYTLKRLDAQPAMAVVVSAQTARDYYQSCDYMLWRNIVHRRHSAWRRVLVTMRGHTGCLLEFGCGTAPISAWVSRRKPFWEYRIDDVPGSPHLQYARWRLRSRSCSRTESVATRYDVITAVDVFEHLDDPLAVAQSLVKRLAPAGYLHWTFVSNPQRNDLDLATREQQDETERWLRARLPVVWEGEGYRVSRCSEAPRSRDS